MNTRLSLLGSYNGELLLYKLQCMQVSREEDVPNWNNCKLDCFAENIMLFSFALSLKKLFITGPLDFCF